MKKLLLVLGLVSFVNPLNAVSLELSVLQEVSAISAYDWQDHQWKAGVISPVFTLGDFSVDVGGVRSLEVGDNADLPIVGLNVHLGSILSKKLPSVAALLPDSGLLGKLTLGGFVGVKKLQVSQLEIVDSSIAYGIYSGLEFKF